MKAIERMEMIGKSKAYLARVAAVESKERELRKDEASSDPSMRRLAAVERQRITDPTKKLIAQFNAILGLDQPK